MFNLDSETRCDFIISQKRKKIWKTQLELLSELQRVCKKYHLRYFAINGTLLGAVRHNGFIPWDDDLDVIMPRPDYEKLTEIAKTEFQKPFYLQNEFTSKKYYRSYSRLRNSNTTAVPEMDWNIEECNGIFIDIFPLDGYSKDEIRNKKVLKKINRQIFLANNFIYGKQYTSHRLIHLGLLYGVAFLDLFGFYTKLLKNTRKIQNINPYDESEILYSLVHGEVLKYKKEWFNEKIVNFEDMKICIPSGYDEILKMIYGSYMDLPPVEKRGVRHNIFFDPDNSYSVYYKKMSFSEVRDQLNNY